MTNTSQMETQVAPAGKEFSNKSKKQALAGSLRRTPVLLLLTCPDIVTSSCVLGSQSRAPKSRSYQIEVVLSRAWLSGTKQSSTRSTTVVDGLLSEGFHPSAHFTRVYKLFFFFTLTRFFCVCMLYPFTEIEHILPGERPKISRRRRRNKRRSRLS